MPLLRAAGADISRYARGYVILRETGGLVRQVAVSTMPLGWERKLNYGGRGCTVLDVIVDHPFTGS